MKNILDNGFKVTYIPPDDGIPLFNAEHPRPKFNLWNWVKAIFIRPKFSKEALEPADEIISTSN